MNEYGIENLEEITWMEDPKMIAFKCLQKRDVVFGYERTAKVAFTESSSQVDEEIMALLHN